MKRVVVLGATSTIAQCALRLLAERGDELLLVGRNAERTEALAADLRVRGAGSVITYAADLADVASHLDLLHFTLEEFPDFDTVLLAYGCMLHQGECRSSVDLALAEWATNFTSAAAVLTLFANELERRRRGCIAVITSVAGERGRASNYVYGSAKGALSLFAQGLRARLHKTNVRVITIKPGPARTAMTAHLPGSGKFASPARVGRDIVRALEHPRDIVYSPWYWRYVMGVLRAIPESVFKRLPL